MLCGIWLLKLSSKEPKLEFSSVSFYSFNMTNLPLSYCKMFHTTQLFDYPEDRFLCFRFPPETESERRQKWVAAVKRKDWKPSSHSVLCSEHFKPDQFQVPPGLKYKARLHSWAVPTEFPSHPAHLQPVSSTNCIVISIKDQSYHSGIMFLVLLET